MKSSVSTITQLYLPFDGFGYIISTLPIEQPLEKGKKLLRCQKKINNNRNDSRDCQKKSKKTQWIMNMRR
jgi:hypothetical protein